MPDAENEGDNRPAVYWEDIGGELFLIIRASAIGHPCLWELVAAGQGIDPGNLPGNMRRAFREGHKLEPIIINKLRVEHGYLQASAQVEGHLILPGNIMIRYHPDGVGQFMKAPHDHLGPLILEVKALSHDNYEKAARGHVGDVVEEYWWQLAVMMHAEKLPAMWAAYDKGFPPDKETGIKPPCDGEGRIYLDPITSPPRSLEEITEKAHQIKELILGEDLLTSTRGCDTPDHFPCRYLHVRPEPETDDSAAGEEGNGVVMEVDSDSDEGRELDQMVRDWLFHSGHAKESKARMDALAEEILHRAGPDTTKIVTDKFIVPISQNTYTQIAWDEMPPDLKTALQAYVEKKKTKKFLRGVKGRG